MLSHLNGWSLLAYTPHPENPEQERSKDLMNAVKTDRLTGSPPIPITKEIAKIVAAKIPFLPFQTFFGANAMLVPIPSSSLKKPEDLWVPYNLAKALEAENLGWAEPCVIRERAVPKAAISKPNERPTAEMHRKSISVKLVDREVSEILLIDDIVTRGSTAMGVASALEEVYPDVPVRLFAALRAVSDSKNFEKQLHPFKWEITLVNGQTFRNPP